MTQAKEPWSPRRFARLAKLAATITMVLFGAGIAASLILKNASPRALWQTGLGFLMTLEVAYGLALAASVLGAPTFALILLRGRNRGMRRPFAARGLLLCLAIALGLILVESAAAAWHALGQRDEAVPVGGFDRGEEYHPARPTPEVTRLPTEFPDAKGDGEIELAVIGESSAQGVPYNAWLSVVNLVTWQLGEAIPERRFRYTLLAHSGETLESQQLELAKLTRRPDALIIYCGHNEFTSRFEWSRDVPHYLDDRDLSTRAEIVARIERTSPLCGMIRRAADRCRVAIPPPRGGYRDLVDVPAYTPSEFRALLDDFRERLERIVAYAERIGAIPILIIPAANDSDFEPNRSFLAPDTPRAGRDAFARDFHIARRVEDSDPSQAVGFYRTLLARQPGFAEAHYRLSRLLDRSGDFAGAYREAVAARDLDGLPMRLPTRFQEAYREVAARHSCILIDSQAYFHAIGRDGMLDDHLFHDAMHPSLRGQIALAQAVLQGLRARRAFGWPESAPTPVIDPGRVVAHYGLGPEPWKQLCLWGAMVYDLVAPAHYDPSGRRAKQAGFQDAFNQISAGRSPESVGLPNIGRPEPVRLWPSAAVLTAPGHSLGNP